VFDGLVSRAGIFLHLTTNKWGDVIIAISLFKDYQSMPLKFLHGLATVSGRPDSTQPGIMMTPTAHGLYVCFHCRHQRQRRELGNDDDSWKLRVNVMDFIFCL